MNPKSFVILSSWYISNNICYISPLGWAFIYFSTFELGQVINPQIKQGLKKKHYTDVDSRSDCNSNRAPPYPPTAPRRNHKVPFIHRVVCVINRLFDALCPNHWFPLLPQKKKKLGYERLWHQILEIAGLLLQFCKWSILFDEISF